MKQIFRTASFLFIFTAFVMPKAFAQHPVIFETFTDDNDYCSAPTQFQKDMISVLNHEGDKDYTKMIHLEHHGLFSDPLYCYSSSAIASRLNGVSGAGNPIFFGAVDRVSSLPNASNGSKAEYDIGLSGSNYTVNPSWVGDMESTIESESGNAPPDVINLVNATLDQSAQYYTFHATVSVTAETSISDSLIIRYAILEDGVSGPVCNAATTHNDVVRYITTGDSVVFVPGTSSGTVKTVTFTQTDLLSANPGNPGAYNPTNLRFIAFIESSGGGDYSVVDAKQLISNFTTLPAPAPTLAISESSISGDTLHPGSVADIFYSATNLQNGVMAYYSLDNGTTWRYISNSSFSPLTWTVPDSATTEGKIKLVAVGDTTLFSIEKGTFTIANPPSVTFIEPKPEKIIKGDSNYTIYWTKVAVGSALLRYSLDNGVTFTKLQDNADTFYVWSVPDTNRGVIIQLVPDNNEAPAAAVIDTIESAVIIPQGVVENGVSPSGLTITSIFPNPASNGQDMVVQYFELQPKPLTVQLLDLLGRIMPETYTTDNLAIHLNTGSLAAGTYVVRVSDGTNTVSKRVEIIR